MTFRATSISPAIAYAHIRGQAEDLRNIVGQRLVKWTGPTNSDQVWMTHWDIRNRVKAMERVRAVPALATFAAQQEADPSYDFLAEADNVIAVARQTMLTIRTELPARGEQFSVDGESVVFNQVSGVKLANIRAALTALRDTIE